MTDSALLATYAQYPFELVRGEGCRVWDAEGREYLDLYGGHAVCLVGHSPPAVVDAIARQAGELLFYSNVAPMGIRERAAGKLASFLPGGSGEWKIFLCNSGTEANEAALKMARAHTARETVLSFEGGFHGRTIASLSATGMPKMHEGVRPLLSGHRHLPWHDAAVVAEAVDDDTAAVLIEPIQSMAGVRAAGEDFGRGIREATRGRGALVIADEVQTAVGRTGVPLAAFPAGLDPDLVTMAKGIASGIPCGAVAVRRPIAERIGVGDHGTTFGGGPVACAALEATLDLVLSGNLMDNAVARERQIRGGLDGVAGVRGVRGKGLLLGIEIAREGAPVLAELRGAGILAGSSADPRVLRLLPPITLSEEEVDRFLATLRGILE